MKKTVLAVVAAGIAMSNLNAQNIIPERQESLNDSIAFHDNQTWPNTALQDLEAEKDRIEKQEKFKLKQALNVINTRLGKNEITAAEAQRLKEDAAKTAALNIDNKLAIIENQRQLLERGSSWTFSYEGGSSLEVGLGNVYDDKGSFMLGVGFKNNSKKVTYDKRTYTDIVVAGGINNAFSSEHSLKDSPYKIWKSGFAELGLAFRTRLLKESNYLRLVYGASLQLHSFELTGNRYFTVDGDQTNFETFPYDLKQQKLRITNLVFPVYVEFGPSKKIEYYDRVRYSTVEDIRFGIGGHAGLNIWNNQFLKYREGGRKIQDSEKRSFNATNFVYGVGGYVGFGPISLYATYDLNPIFKNGPARQNVFSLALRVDL